MQNRILKFLALIAIANLPQLIATPLGAQIKPNSASRASANRTPTFKSNDFTSNRYNGMRPNTLQVTIYYDGDCNASPSLKIQYKNSQNDKKGWIEIENIQQSSHQDKAGIMETREYDMGCCVLTGRFEISGIEPDGVIDGIAFGLYWKDAQSRYHLLKSRSKTNNTGARFVGIWPTWISRDHVVSQTPDMVSSGFAHNQAFAAIMGAEYLSNGKHRLQILKGDHTSRPTAGSTK